MLTAEQIDALRTQSEQLLDPVVEFLVRDIAERVAGAGQLTSTAAYQVWVAQELGLSQKEIKSKIQKLLNISMKEVEQLLTQVAEVGYNFDISQLPTNEAIPFAENTSLQQIVATAVKLTQGELENLTRTMGFMGPDGKVRELGKAYQNICDYAFKKIVSGAQDYASALRDATRNLAKRGILKVDYASGYRCSIEAATRQSVMGGLGLMQEQISQQNHDDLGCDGWELSAHAGSAPDHEPYQGKQYTDEEYTKLNNMLLRRIGTLNCGHAAFPIILGVNDPQYSPEELEQMRLDNEAGVTINGRHYTTYEATQRQRKYERSIRNQKRKILIDETLGDKDKLQTDQIRLVRLRDEYKRFSKEAGLPMQHDRMDTAGFTWKHGKAAESTAKAMEKAVEVARQEKILLEKQSAEEYNKRKEAALQRIRSDELPKTLNRGNQQKHIKDSPGYIAGRSYIYGDLETAQELVYSYYGKGEPQFNRKGEWNNKEVVSADKIIGVNVEMDTGEESETHRFVVHYGKKGTHVVPTKELE